MSRLDLAAETTKLARLLNVPEAQLAWMQPLGAERMRALRERINAAVFDDTRPMLVRVAASSITSSRTATWSKSMSAPTEPSG